MSKTKEKTKDKIRQSEDYKTAFKILEPLYSDIKRAKEFTAPSFYLFEQMCLDFKERWEEANRVSEILGEIKTFRYGIPDDEHNVDKEFLMKEMFVYLGLVESLGVALVDATLILLIANGRDIHTRGPMTRHVKTTRDLEEIDLTYKLDFLKDEGLDLFKKLIDRDVRNCIAHLKFTIQDDGEIRKRDGSPIHINETMLRFRDGVDTLKLVFEDVGLLKWFEIGRC